MKIGRTKQYAGVLQIPEGKLDGVEVRHVHKPAGTVLESGTLRTAMYGQKSDSITFEEPTVWHELSEDQHGVWMTDYPIEQRQTDGLIARARGRVLVGGLGLGYAVVALAARQQVREIVVVEKSPAIIALVWEATVRQVRALFPNRTVQLTVVNADLFDYLTERQEMRPVRQKIPEFAWGLFDIWQSDGECTFHEVVVPLRTKAHGVVGSLVCWNEDIMRGQLYQGLEHHLMLVRMTDEQKAALLPMVVISLDQLTADTDCIYQQWAVPFWRWYKDYTRPGGVYDKAGYTPATVEELVKLHMLVYVRTYGRPEAANLLPALRPYRSKATTELATQ
jgi:hypothetical protein